MTLKPALVLSAQNSVHWEGKGCWDAGDVSSGAVSWVGAALGTQLPLLRVSAPRCRWIPHVAHAQAHAQKEQNLRAISVSWWKLSAARDQTNGLISADVLKLLQSEMTATWEKGKEWEWAQTPRWCLLVPQGSGQAHTGAFCREEKWAVSSGVRYWWARVLPLPTSLGPCYLADEGDGWKQFSSPFTSGSFPPLPNHSSWFRLCM